RPDGGVQVTIRRRDHPYIDPDRPGPPDTLELSLLEDAQQGELRVGRKIAHLVEEDGPAICELEAAEAPLQRSGERALFVTEELRTVYQGDAGSSAADFHGIVGRSAALQRVLRLVETVATTDAAILIRGET